MNGTWETAKSTESWSSPSVDDYRFELQEENSCLIAVFCGEVSTDHYSEFRNDYNEICRRLSLLDRQRLIIDLTNTTFFSSVFVGIMMKLSMTIGNQNGDLALCGLSKQLDELMKKLLLLEPNGADGGGLRHFANRTEALSCLSSNVQP